MLLIKNFIEICFCFDHTVGTNQPVGLAIM